MSLDVIAPTVEMSTQKPKSTLSALPVELTQKKITTLSITKTHTRLGMRIKTQTLTGEVVTEIVSVDKEMWTMKVTTRITTINKENY